MDRVRLALPVAPSDPALVVLARPLGAIAVRLGVAALLDAAQARHCRPPRSCRSSCNKSDGAVYCGRARHEARASSRAPVSADSAKTR